MIESNSEIYNQSLYMIHNRLFFRLFQVNNSLDRQCLNELSISPVHWSVMGALSRPHLTRAGMSFFDLIEYLGTSRQSLDNVLKRAGSVQRVTSHQDKPVKNIALAASGQQSWLNLQNQFFQFYRQAMSGFAFDDLVSLIHLLNKLNHGLKQI